MRRGGSPNALKLTAIASHTATQKITLAIRISIPPRPGVSNRNLRSKAILHTRSRLAAHSVNGKLGGEPGGSFQCQATSFASSRTAT
jgi:hypothetical protein